MSLFTSTPRERRMAWRAGLFVAMGLALAGVVVFFIGQETRLFEEQVVYRAYFPNVQGLTEESPVWLGGLEVGQVLGIGFTEDTGNRNIEVRFRISRRYADRVREDSVARLSSLGLLGEKAVDVSLGSMKVPPVPDGGELPTDTTGDLNALLQAAGQLMEDSKAISSSLRVAVETYADPRLAEDISASLHSLRGLLEEVEKGDGVLHALIYDKEAGRQVRGLLADAAQTARRVDGAVGHVEALLAEVRHGDGTAHALIYGKEGAKALSELGAAAGQLAVLMEDARKNPEGAVHKLVYGDSGNMLADLGSAAADIKQITSMVARGEGSLGGILKDPTVYEDLREVVGNVRRNKVLRTLVRFAISNNDNVQYVGRPIEAPKDDESRTGIGGAGESPPESPKTPPLILPLPPPVPPNTPSP